MGKQFVVRVDNRPGAASRLFGCLALRAVHIEHVAGVSCDETGLVVLTAIDAETARDALRTDGYQFSEGESFVIRVPDRAGALAEATKLLADAGVNVSSVLEVGTYAGSIDLAFTVDDLGKAQGAIAESEFAAVSWRGA